MSLSLHYNLQDNRTGLMWLEISLYFCDSVDCVPAQTNLPTCLITFSETRLLEIVETACEKSDFECNKLLEQIEDQVETWWFHR